MSSSSTTRRREERTCVICTDKITKPCFLYGCAEAGVRDHIFDEKCIRFWYKTSGSRSCPLCKRPSALIFLEKDAPSSVPFENLPMRKALRFEIPKNLFNNINSEEDAENALSVTSKLTDQLELAEDETYCNNNEDAETAQEQRDRKKYKRLTVKEEKSDEEEDDDYGGDDEEDYSSEDSGGEECIAFSERRGEKNRYNEGNYERYCKRQRKKQKQVFLYDNGEVGATRRSKRLKK